MKKAVLCLFAFALAYSAFARASMEDSNYVGVNMTVPLEWEWIKQDGVETKGFMNSLGVSLDALTMFSPFVGGYVSLDFFWPLKLSTTTAGYSVSVGRDAYDSLFGLDLLFAAAFAPIHTDRLLFSISPGVHYMMIFADARYSTVSYLFGLGAAIDVRCNVTDAFYLRAGVDIAYDFLGINIGYNSVRSAGSNILNLQPKVGVGFRY